MGTTSKRHSAEVRKRAVRMVSEQREKYGSQSAAIQSIADKIGCTSESLRRWLRQSEQAVGSADYAAKRAELVKIAAKLFKQMGFQSTTLADIALEAGLDRATVYYYFNSKEELFQQAVEGVLDDNIEAAKALIKNGSLKSIERLHRIFVTLMISYEENYPATFVYIQEQMQRVGAQETAWAQEIIKKTRAFDRVLLEFIRGAVAEGDLRADISPRLLERALFGMLNWTHRWFVPGRGMSGREVAEAFWSIFVVGALCRTATPEQTPT